jgi:hypothetical protein
MDAYRSFNTSVYQIQGKLQTLFIMSSGTDRLAGAPALRVNSVPLVPQAVPPTPYEPPSLAKVREVLEHCYKSDEGPEQLGDLISRLARKLCPQKVNTPIFPNLILKQVLSPERVRLVLEFYNGKRRNKFDEAHLFRHVDDICGHKDSIKLGPFGHMFASLALCGKECDIFQFIHEGFDDSLSPFAVEYDKGLSSIKNPERVIACAGSWNDRILDHFHTLQWRVFLPFFEQDPNGDAIHYEFENDTCMPWYATYTQSHSVNSPSSYTQALGGSYGDVFPAIIPAEHHGFNLPNTVSTQVTIVLSE